MNHFLGKVTPGEETAAALCTRAFASSPDSPPRREEKRTVGGELKGESDLGMTRWLRE